MTESQDMNKNISPKFAAAVFNSVKASLGTNVVGSTKNKFRHELKFQITRANYRVIGMNKIKFIHKFLIFELFNYIEISQISL